MVSLLQPRLISVQELFSECLFQIPDYQRAYAWERKQCEDLWEDIREGMSTKTPHFLGTVVLMSQDELRRDREGRSLRVFQLVDGQQRATTLCLLLLAVYDRVRSDHDRIARGLWRDFIEHENGLRKLQLGKLNAKYFKELVAAVQSNQEPPTDQRLTNARLRKAFCRLRELMEDWLQIEGENVTVSNLVSYVRDELQVLCFFTDSRRLAIKTFQTVNDRGKKLSLLDKTKSFLMFYITRYLEDDAKVFRIIEEKFGRVFDSYDAVKDLANKFSVNYLVSPQFRFNEDEFLRYAYHYGARDLISRFRLPYGYEYGITPERVFDEFVKGACRHLRNDPAVLGEFVVDWCKDLDAVSRALTALLERIPKDTSYEQLFRFQGPNASIYPLLVTAEAQGFLDEAMLKAIAVLDLRVYQIRGTDPKADLYRCAVSMMKTGKRNDIYNHIVGYCHEFGTDQALDSYLRGYVYRQSFTKYVLWQCAVADDRETDPLDYELYADCQVDHVLPDNPSTFDVTTFGFDTDEDFEASKHSFGNLTVLESQLNRRAQNRPPGDKAREYAKSHLQWNRVLGTRIGQAGFTRETQADRLDDIVKFFKRSWPISAEKEVSP